jgi:hypothetical protein
MAITSAGSGGRVLFTAACTITLTSTITLGENVRIDGNGHTVTISGGGSVPVFAVVEGATVTLNDLTIADGNRAFGGGSYNNGTLTITNSTVSSNSAPGSIPGGAGSGIDNDYYGTLTIMTAAA